jgi:uncharacterized coiled-coil protein SlyX
MALFPVKLGDFSYPVPHDLLCQTCGLFLRQSLSPPYSVAARPDLTNFQAFLKALSGDEIEITRANYADLSHLAEEFECRTLLSRLAAFRESPQYRIPLLEDQIQRQEQTIAELRQSLAAHEIAIAELRAERIDRASARAIAKKELSAQIGQLHRDFMRETDRKLANSKSWHSDAISELDARLSELEVEVSPRPAMQAERLRRFIEKHRSH